MNKDEYFKISSKLRFPKRCPIFNYCQRRIFSIMFFSYNNSILDIISLIKEEGGDIDDYKKNEIKFIGDSPSFSKDNDFFSFSNFCPEIALFSTDHSPGLISILAISDGDYTFENKKWVTQIENYKHFSECQEFCNYDYIHKKIRVTQKRRTGSISKKLRFEIFQRDDMKCQYCGKTQKDGIRLELDHKTPYSRGGKDTFANLITSCNECNSGKSDKII